MKTRITQVLDFSKINNLLESFNRTTGFVTAIIDLDGHILSQSGWRCVCTDFHRIHPSTARNCTISDTILANQMGRGEKYHFYKCMNGLVDLAMPIVLNGEHIANLFSGQFFLEEPDMEFFSKQATKYGFDEEKYLNSIRQVPIVSEEKAKTAMDFLHQMTMLISEQAYQKMELDQLSEQKMIQEAKFKAIFEAFPHPISINSLPDGIYTDVNPAYLKYRCLDREKIIGLTTTDPTLETNPELSLLARKKLLETGQLDLEPHKSITLEGEELWMNYSSRIFNIKSDQYVLSVLTDISRQKQTEKLLTEAYEKTKAIFNQSNQFIGLLSFDGVLIDANKPSLDFIDKTLEEVANRHFWDTPWWSHSTTEQKKIRTAIAKAANGDQIQFETTHIDRNGNERNFDLIIKPIEGNNEKVNYLIVEGIDITERKNNEELIKHLSTSFAHLVGKSFFEAISTDAAKALKLDYVFVGLLNDNEHSVTVMGGYSKGTTMGELTYHLTGTPCEDVIGKEVCTYVADIRQLFPADELLQQMHIEGYIGVSLYSKDNRPIGILVGLNEKRIANAAKVEQVFSFYKERVSAELQRTLAEAALQESESQFRGLFDFAADAIFIADMETGIILNANEKAGLLMKRSVDELINMHQRELHPPERNTIDEDTFQKQILEIKGTGYATPVKNFIICSEGTQIPVEIISSEVKYRGKNCLMGIFRDISERKKYEEQLIIAKEKSEKNEKAYKDVVETTSDLITVVDGNGKIAFVNHASMHFWGLSPDTCIGKSAFDFILEEDKEYTLKHFAEWLKSEASNFYFENRQAGLHNQVLNVAWNIHVERSENQIIKITSIARDITAIKRAENELITAKEKTEESEALLNITNKIANVGGWEIKLKTNELIWTKQVFEIHEVDNEFVPTVEKAIDFYDSKSAPIIKEAVNEAIVSGKSFDIELKIITAKGNSKDVRAIGYIKYDTNKVAEYVYGSFQDITEKKQAQEEQIKMAREWQTTFDNVNNTIWLLDKDLHIIRSNKTAERMFGFPISSMLGKKCCEVLHGTTNPVKECPSYKVQNSKQREQMEVEIGEKTYEITVDPILDMEVNLTGIVHIIRDITDRKKDENQLRKLSQAVEQSPASVVITDTKGNIEYVNPKFIDATGYSFDEVIGKNPRVLKSGEQSPEYYKELWETIQSGNEWKGEFLNKKKNGELYWESARILPIKNIYGATVNYLAVKEDITERKNIEQQLGNTLNQLQKFASHIQNVREEEKASLAREIHDDLGQLLVALKIDTGVIKALFANTITPSRLESIKQSLNEHAEMITKAITSARRIMYGLRPVKLEMLGFAGAAMEYIADFSSRYAIKCEANIDINLPTLDEDRSLAMYRILQETMMNIVKHAKATKVELKYYQQGNDILFEVKDNGVGFTVGKDGREDSYGLLGINERVSLLKGTLRIDSSPGHGTRIEVRFCP